TTADKPFHLDPGFTVGNIRIAVASLATLARPAPVDVAFDMRPGSCRNPFNPKSRGVSTALVLGSTDVDVRDIDIDELRLAGSVSPLTARVTDVGVPGDDRGRPCAGMSPDGYDDLRLTFSSVDIARAIGPVTKGDTVRLHLTGCLTDGTGIRGDDEVVIVGEQDDELETAQSFDTVLTNTETAAGEPPLPEAFALYQNNPNPFNPSTSIRFDVPSAGAVVTLRIWDVSGRLVRTLVDEIVGGGLQERTWDGKDASGNPVGSGIYFYRLTAGNRTLTRKMVLLK
ncbi:MAG: FlgD immunoglobulin-like domain containing protein, partial [bacterium]